MTRFAHSNIIAAPDYRAVLADAGFEPVVGCRKVAGAPRDWKNSDGRTALVGYNLLSRTGQRSAGAGANWGYVIKFN